MRPGWLLEENLGHWKSPSTAALFTLSQGLPLASLWLPRIEHESEVSPLKARVYVTLKNGVLDPQGKAIQQALGGLGFSGVGGVRQGKVIDLELAESDREKAHAQVKSMCERLLANTVIENYDIELTD
jgi:phosphoribosylformylglycinamidine synthase